jgi:arginyl-tRNA synthetase
METTSRVAVLIEKAILAAYPGIEGLPTAAEIEGMLEIPPERALGDYAFPCFKLSKALHMGPPMIALKVKEAMPQTDACAVEAVGGYLNVFLNKAAFAKETLEAISKAGEAFGSGNEGKGKTVCLDYSSINIAKRFHIGHLSTTMIGHSLKRIYDFLGYKTVGINHLGDWGTQFGKMICAYKRWGTKEEIEKGGVQALVDLYVKFHEEAEKEPALEDEGRAWFKKIEDGDAEALQIFDWFKELTLKDTERVYELLGVTFDSYNGESFYQDKMGRVVDELKAKNLLTLSQGASIVDLEEYKMPPCLILKSDGTTLYTTRDIAAALYRHDTYHFDKCLYVTAYHQDLHFRQWFKVVDLMGYDFAKDLVHVAYGMVSFEGESLSTRKGHMIYLDDVMDMAREKALKIINEKSPGLENKEEVARQVGIGALVYSTLNSSRIKDVDFWFERALNFDGETGPYVQYTHARCCSVLRKADGLDLPAPDYSALCDEEAQALLHLMNRFPKVLREAVNKYEPFMVTRVVTDICQAYNKFYYEHRILDEAPEVVAARVDLTRAAKDIIKTGLYLIGMEAPERM